MIKIKSKIPINWKEVSLLEECFFDRGIEPGRNNYNTLGYGKRFLRVADLTGSRNEIIYTEIESDKESSNKDILLTLDGSVGVVKRGFKGIYSTGIRKVYFKDKKNYSDDFLYYLLQGKDIQRIINYYSKGSTIKHASRSIDFMNVIIPKNKEEQQKIAEILSKVDYNINKTEEIIQHTEKLKRGLMKELLIKGIGHKKFKKTELGEIPWEWVFGNFQTIVDKKNKNAIKPGPFGSSLKKDIYVKSGYKIYGQEQVIRGDLEFGDYYITKEKFRSLEDFKISSGDILVSLVGTIGKIIVVPEKFKPGIINPRLIKISLDKNISDPYYFSYLLISDLIRDQVNNMLHGGTMNILNGAIIKKIKFPIPSIHEQKIIVDILTSVDNKIEVYKKIKDKLNLLKKGLMNDLLSGEVRINLL